MIQNLNVRINTYEEKIINNFKIIEYSCPKCRAKHNFNRHGYYDRHVCFFDEEFNVKERNITILRLLCKSCESTHAVLPYDIIPYKNYDRGIFYKILNEHFVFKISIEKLSEKYKISTKTLWHFVKTFILILNSLCVFLKVLGIDIEINDISKIVDTFTKWSKEELYGYYTHSKCILLMTKFKNVLSSKIHIGVIFKPPT